jgi:hypothetical protein
MLPTPRSSFGFVLAGLALLALLVSAGGPVHSHDDGIFNDECQLAALATLGGAVALVQDPPVLVPAPAVVSAPRISGPALVSVVSGGIGSRAPPHA